jgi:dTDP-4-dehydrorhamnose 3,5-epimerase
MKLLDTSLPGVLIVECRVYRDDRGHFVEVWQEGRYREAGLDVAFVQDNLSVSRRGVLRGLHYQHPGGQGKLVSVAQGAVYDVAVDVRRGSPTFGRWTAAELSAENGRQMYVPPGFAHGFLVLREPAVFLYKCTAPYRPGSEGSIRWDDPDLGIAWPRVEGMPGPLLSPKDAEAPRLCEVPAERLPAYEPGGGS